MKCFDGCGLYGLHAVEIADADDYEPAGDGIGCGVAPAALPHAATPAATVRSATVVFTLVIFSLSLHFAFWRFYIGRNPTPYSMLDLRNELASSTTLLGQAKSSAHFIAATLIFFKPSGDPQWS